jgi:hypothetical protein
MKAAAAGAQTERPGVAVAGEGFAWRQDLTGRFVGFEWIRFSASLAFAEGEEAVGVGSSEQRQGQLQKAVSPSTSCQITLLGLTSVAGHQRLSSSSSPGGACRLRRKLWRSAWLK